MARQWLMSQTVDTVRRLARQLNIASSGSKGVVIERLMVAYEDGEWNMPAVQAAPLPAPAPSTVFDIDNYVEGLKHEELIAIAQRLGIWTTDALTKMSTQDLRIALADEHDAGTWSVSDPVEKTPDPDPVVQPAEPVNTQGAALRRRRIKFDG